MAQLFANNVSTKLDTSIQSTDTSMTVWSSTGMPTLGVGDYFLLTLVGLTDGSETAWEIVKVTAVVGNTLTVVRAQEGTTAQFWAGGTKVEARLTAGSVPGVDDAVTSETKTWSSSKIARELAAAGGNVQKDVFTTSGTWTKPAGCKYVRVLAIGGGAGGGSGRVGAADTVRTGGAGGGAGGVTYKYHDADDLGSTEIVVVGAGGIGGASVSTPDTDGLMGSNGGETHFGGSDVYTSKTTADNGGVGYGGRTSAANGGVGGVLFSEYALTAAATTKSNGLSSSSNGTGNLTNQSSYLVSVGGGCGAGIGADNTVWNGGRSTISLPQAAVIGAGAPLAGTGNSGGDGITNTYNMGLPFATGGTGGASSLTTNGGNGGNGLYGSGGGGGAAAVNGFSSGAGGNGGDGIVIVWSYF